MCVYFYLIHILVSWYDSQIRHQTWRRHRRRPKEVGSGGPWAEDRWDLSWEYQRFGGWSWMKIKNLRFIGVFLKSEIYGIENGTENMSENRIVFCLIKMNREKLTISKSVLGLGWRWARRFNYGNASSSGIKFHPPVTFHTSKCILDMNVRGGWNLNELNEISIYHYIIRYNQYIYYFGASKSSDP